LIDGDIYNYIVGGLAFGFALLFLLIKINKYNPSLLRPARIRTEELNGETTFNWNQIGSIVSGCFYFGVAIVVLFNLMIFSIFGEWYIDRQSSVVIVIAFAIYVFREFDKYVTKFLG
jgi:hypothetical protein